MTNICVHCLLQFIIGLLLQFNHFQRTIILENLKFIHITTDDINFQVTGKNHECEILVEKLCKEKAKNGSSIHSN